MTPPRSILKTFLLALTLSALPLDPLTLFAADLPNIGITSPLKTDPTLELPVQKTLFDPRSQSLWTLALARPDAATKTQAASALADAASQGLSLTEETLAALRKTLPAGSTPEDIQLRYAIVRALLAANAPDIAANIDRLNASSETELLLLSDPYLARLTPPPAAASERWLLRLSNKETPRQVRLSALRCLVHIRASGAIQPLAALTLDSREDPPLRLASADALASLDIHLAEKTAATLLPREKSADKLSRLLASRLLVSTKATDLLSQLLADSEPAVVLTAARTLLRFSPDTVAAASSTLIKSPDISVRQAALQAAYIRHTPADTNLLLASLADSTSPVRGEASNSLAALVAASQSSSTILDACSKLASSSTMPEAGEALLVLSAAKDPRALPLIQSWLTEKRPDQRVAALVAARHLADLSLVAPLLDRSQTLTTALADFSKPVSATEARNKTLLADRVRTAREYQVELAQLQQTLGLLGDKAATKSLLAHAANSKADSDSRASAVWALGKIYARSADPKIIRPLAEFMLNRKEIPQPEDIQVRAQSAVALGLIGGTPAIDKLRAVNADDPFEVQSAARWARQLLTGTKEPSLVIETKAPPSFLEPVVR